MGSGAEPARQAFPRPGANCSGSAPAPTPAPVPPLTSKPPISLEPDSSPVQCCPGTAPVFSHALNRVTEGGTQQTSWAQSWLFEPLVCPSRHLAPISCIPTNSQ